MATDKVEAEDERKDGGQFMPMLWESESTAEEGEKVMETVRRGRRRAAVPTEDGGAVDDGWAAEVSELGTRGRQRRRGGVLEEAEGMPPPGAGRRRRRSQLAEDSPAEEMVDPYDAPAAPAAGRGW